MVYYLMAVAAALGCAGNFAVSKVYQKQMGNGAREGVLFNALTGLFTGVLFFAIAGFRWEYTAFSLVMAIALTILTGTYTILGFRILSLGSMTVYTVFSMLGGAVVPYLYGVFFLSETVNLQKVLALLLVVCAVLLSLFEEKGKKPSLRFILLCFAVFFLNGGVSVVSKLHQIETDRSTVSAGSFVMLNGMVRFVLFGAILLFFRENTAAEQREKLNLKMYLVMIASALISGGSYLLQLVCASNMPATVLYPLVTGGTIAFSSVFDRVCFGQRMKIRTIISISACIVSLILFVAN